MTEKLKRPQSVVTRLEDSWPGSGTEHRELVVAEVNRGIGRMALPRRWTPEELRARKLIHVGMKERNVLNTFRQLRTQLLQKRRDENMTVLTTAAGEGEESSALNGVNLAAAFALDPQKTAMYIDCNPYRPTAERFLLGRPTYGLTDYLDDPEIPIERIIYASGVDRLRVIPVGRAAMSAPEQFQSTRMQALIEDLKQRYSDRFIIMNAPSLSHSPEAQVLAQYCDATVLVAPYGKVSAADIESAYQSVDKQRLAGLIYSYL
jgi:protein-tyrosine kinase